MAESTAYAMMVGDVIGAPGLRALFAQLPAFAKKTGADLVVANGENGHQMRPGNAWLRELSEAVVPVPFTSIYSVHDTVISPQDSSVMPGASNVRISAIGHVSMPGGARARDVLVRELGRLHTREAS